MNSGETGLEFFAVGILSVETLAEVHQHLEAHRDERATVGDLVRALRRFEPGLARSIATELHHVLIMLTKGRSQRLVLKAAESEWSEAYRLLLPKDNPISTPLTARLELLKLLA